MITECNHEGAHVEFDIEDARQNKLTASEVRKKYPRFYGPCPDCGGGLIKYASFEHYVYGDW